MQEPVLNDHHIAPAQILERRHSSADENHSSRAEQTFLDHRNLLFTVAYEILGSAADAEDALQEAWLLWARVDQDSIKSPRAYLVQITTRQALGHLRTLGRRKESYVGPWLPEPLLTARDVAEDVELADSVSIAMLMVLETLTHIERAVFVLREVFELGYSEIAIAVDKSPGAVRQIAHRARAHVKSRRPRGTVTRAEVSHAVRAFQAAVETGDLHQLLSMLAPHVVLLTDGGGAVRAALTPVVGASQVSLVLSRIAGEMSLQSIQVNGTPAISIRLGGETDTVLAMRFDDGLITELYAVRNPTKLAHLGREVSMCR